MAFAFIDALKLCSEPLWRLCSPFCCISLFACICNWYNLCSILGQVTVGKYIFQLN